MKRAAALLALGVLVGAFIAWAVAHEWFRLGPLGKALSSFADLE